MLGAELGTLNVTQDNLADLQAFARDHFDPPHVVPDNAATDPHRDFKIITRDGIWVGYYEVCRVPVVYPAFSRRVRSRDIWEVMMRLVGWSTHTYGDGFVGTPLQRVTFPEHLFRKLGFFRTGNELYKVIPK